MSFLLALITSVLGVVPLLVAKRFKAVAWLGGITLPLLWLVYYLAIPSLVWPLWGLPAGLVVTLWVIGAFTDWYLEYEESCGRSIVTVRSTAIAAAGILILTVRSCGGCAMFRADDYAKLIGEVEKREWTQDVQPKDPRHVRLVPAELAKWLANKQLGEAPGAIGSQFMVSNDHLTLQMIRGELWYVAPLDFKDFGVWNSARVSPGYVMVHGEDPLRPVIVKFGEKFAYTPGAYFSHNLERHLRNHGYLSKGLTDFTFEIDEAGKAWWVVSVFEPTIAYWGEKVLGVAIVDPTDGSHSFHRLGSVPDWVDRAIPRRLVKDYVNNRGKYSGGWVNSWWSEKDLTMAKHPTLIYGSDGQPYWVTDITSANDRDQSLVGLMYTNSRTGRSVFYHAVGGTNEAVLQAVDNKVAYRRWHGDSPVLYNIYGTMASIVPLLGENHTYQGVAIVRVDNLQVAIGEDELTAFREYQKLVAAGGQQAAPELKHDAKVLKGTVDRFAAEAREKGTNYYLHLAGIPHLFIGGSELSPKLPLTKIGDEVEVRYIASEEDVVAMLSFDNQSLPLKTSALQDSVRKKAEERRRDDADRRDGETVRDKVNRMNDAELKRLIESQKPSK